MKRHRLASAEPPLPPPVPIPDDLIREILLWLPVKPLLRFMCVCKSWKLTISDSQFVKLHLRRSSAKNAESAFTRILYDLFSSGGIGETPPPVPQLFSEDEEDGYNLIGVCNGLISLRKWESHYSEETGSMTDIVRVRLCNPVTRMESQLSPPINPCSFGFGYDCLNDTYKVVAVSSIEEKEQRVVKVYDMGASCWRTIQPFPAQSIISRQQQKGVYVSGTLNWVVQRQTINTNLIIIVSLDLGTEEYSQLSLPDSPLYGGYFELPLLGVFKDCLCILENNHGDDKFRIWQMKEFGVHKSWTQLYNFVFEDVFRKTTFFYPQGFILSENDEGFILSENDEVLLISHNDIVLYNHSDHTFEISNGYRDYSLFHGWNAENYVESLVSPY